MPAQRRTGVFRLGLCRFRGATGIGPVREFAQRVAEQVQLDAGMTVSYSRSVRNCLERANARLAWVVPATLLIIFVLLLPDPSPLR